MKTKITILLLLCFISLKAQKVIEHVTTTKNTNAHITTINHEATNGKKDVILIITQKFGVYNDNEVGVWYSNGKWKLFNQNRKAMPNNAKFNILVLPKRTKQAFVHTTTSVNTKGHLTTIDAPILNNKANALVFITQNFGSYNTSNVGIWYNGGKWKIYNENTQQKMPIGTKFNVLVLNPEKNIIGDLNLFAFKYKNTSSGHVSIINTPLQFTDKTTLFTTPNWFGTYNPNITGVWKSGKRWTIFNQNKKTLPKNVQFNVLATNTPVKTIVRRPRPVTQKVLTKNVILPGYKTRENISYIVKNNQAIYQGDILLGSAANVVDPKPDSHPTKRDFSVFRNGEEVGSRNQNLIVRQSDGLVDRDWLWPFGIIPYRINSGFSSAERSLILEAIQEINTVTNLNIVPNNGNYHLVMFIKDTDLAGAGQSRVGRVRTPQRVKLNTNFSKGTVIHELLHAAGFWHEQSRSDRDRYIRINWDNIRDDLKSNFDKHSSTGYKVTPYDKNSVMHYGGYAFSKDPSSLPTIIDLNTNNPFVSQSVLSDLDIAGINTVYDTDYVTYVTRPITALRFVKTTILNVQSNDRDGGRKTEIDFYMKNETGPGWNWRPGGASNPTEWHTTGKVEEADNDISPNWQFRYAIARNEEFAKVWLHLRDDDGAAFNERTDEDIDINYFPGVKGVELFIRTTDGQIFLGDVDGVRLDENYLGQIGEELEVEGYEGPIRAKMKFKIEIE